jgi:RNA polymerase sigma-70 factor, ECF subfamily
MNMSSASTTTHIDRDGPLVAALRRHDPTAAEDLVAAYGNRAFRLAARITGNAQDAEEAVQDALLSVIRKIDTFREESAFGSWLYRIVANAAYGRCRRVRRGDVSLDQLLPVFDEHGRHAAPVPDWSLSVHAPVRQTELRMVLNTAIDELPADYRTVVLLRDVEGLSQQETAEALGLTVVNVKARLHRARLFLRKRLGEHLAVPRTSDPRPTLKTTEQRRTWSLVQAGRDGSAISRSIRAIHAPARALPTRSAAPLPRRS